MNKAEFDQAVAYAISQGYFRDASTPDMSQSTNENGLISLRTPRGTLIAEFRQDGDSFDGIGALSKSSAPAQFSNFECSKCGSNSFEKGEMRVAGGFWSSAMEVENRRFLWIACSKCGYTELYKSTVPGVQQFFDFISGN